MRAGDDAADALWMDVSLRLVSEEDGQQRKEIWELCLDHEERKVHVAARVERTYFPDAVLPRERYRLPVGGRPGCGPRLHHHPGASLSEGAAGGEDRRKDSPLNRKAGM